jgi:myosin-15
MPDPGDPAVSGFSEIVMGNYLVQRGIYDENIRDELYCMLCNQTWLNPNDVCGSTR